MPYISHISTDEIPKVAIGIMNDTHYEEVDLINALIDLLNDNELHTDEIKQHLEHWLQHTKEHFDRENNLMEKYGFPAYAIHSSEHQQVFDEMTKLFADWKKQPDKEKLAHYISQTWLDWFKNHVASMDMMTAQFLSQVM